VRGLEPCEPPEGLSPDQKLIWWTFERAKIAAVKKNQDYGASIFKRPVMRPDLNASSAIEVRMSDKLERIRHLCKGAFPAVKEVVEDTFIDLGTYCFLWVVAKEKEWRALNVATGVEVTAHEGGSGGADQACQAK
jgi:hypothetical protein